MTGTELSHGLWFVALLHGLLFAARFFCWGCTRVAAHPELFLEFVANVSDDEVEFPCGAAAEPVPEDILVKKCRVQFRFVSGKSRNMSGTTKAMF